MSWAIDEKGYSQRGACRLVGMHAKTTYRYCSRRADDSTIPQPESSTCASMVLKLMLAAPNGPAAPASTLPEPEPALTARHHGASRRKARRC